MNNLKVKSVLASIMLSTALTACGSATDFATKSVPEMGTIAKLDSALINLKSLVETPSNVPCTLEDGTEGTCRKFVIKYMPDDQPIGPFCPKTLNDVGGIWDWDGDNPGLYRVDREFLEMLDAQGFTFYDPDSSVHIADISVAQPVHDHACINVSEDEDVQMTLLIPQNPILAETTSRLGVVSKVGLALDGAPIFSDAPSVQHTGHMPALDTCGGHIDPGGWYHFHGTASDLDGVYERENIDAKCALMQDSTALFGFAFDGFPIYGTLELDGSKSVGLDSCGGHSLDRTKTAETYHYHASESFPNLPKCLSGVSARNNFVTTAQAGVGAARQVGQSTTRREPPGSGRGQADMRGGGGLPPGFEQAAKTLGLSADELFKAMESAGGRNADLKEAAALLGVSEEALRAALPQRPSR